MLHTSNMSWRHGRKRIREALDAADAAGFKVEMSTGHGHAWGYVTCPHCGQRLSVWSTPRNDDNHAKQIERFIRRHIREQQ
jgi:phage terminase large subunit GpA-like protein